MRNKEIGLSVVMPAYLETENLRVLLPRLLDCLKKTATSYEALVIDVESPLDSTQSMCEEFGAIYVNREHGNYYGSAVRTGIKKARGKYILFMDVDGSHTPEFIRKLYEKRGENCVVIASRYVQGGYTDDKKSLVFMSKILNKIYGFVLRLNIKDISNSFKLYDTALLKNLKLKCVHFDIVEEIIYKIVRHNRNVKVIEIPYSFEKRMFGKTKRNLMIFCLTFFVTLVRLILSDL